MPQKATAHLTTPSADTSSLFRIADEQSPEIALTNLIALVCSEERPYEDVAEQIEDRAYELCNNEKLSVAIKELCKLSTFFESLHEKNDEQSRDLADIYLLAGQIHQFAGAFAESIEWFSKAAIVDDRYEAPYHSMAVSYTHTGNLAMAIRSYEQELELAQGNYYTYLLLADLYEREGNGDAVETCLQKLLERDPANIQGLHSLIRHYETTNTSIDTGLLIRRLLGVNRRLSRIEVVIKSFYLCRAGKYREVLANIDTWTGNSETITITELVKAHACNEMRQYKKSRQILQNFKMRNHGRTDSMTGKLQEFKTLFGASAANALARILMLSLPKN